MREFSEHAACLALATVLRGNLCTTLFDRNPERVPKGTHLFQPGDPSTVLYRVVSGLIGLQAVGPEGEEITLRWYGPGEVFGELCFCGGVQLHFATALEPADIVSVKADRVLQALRDRPDLALDLIALLSERLAAAYVEMQAASGDTLIVRLARKLVELCTAQDADGWYRLPHRLTHDGLAQLLAVRRESLTRAMIDLRALGLVDYRPHGPIRVSSTGVRRFLSASRSTPLLPQQPAAN